MFVCLFMARTFYGKIITFLPFFAKNSIHKFLYFYYIFSKIFFKIINICKYKCMYKHYYFFFFLMFTLSEFLNVLVSESLFCSSKLHLFDQKYSKNRNIVK